MIGWAFVQPLQIFSINWIDNNLSLFGTIISFILFLILLPKWAKIRWSSSQPWRDLGISRKHNLNRFFLFFKGILVAISLILVLLIALNIGGWLMWKFDITNSLVLNAIALLFGVGIAEELIFRGWLLEEIKFLFGKRSSLIGQAVIFSLVHIRFDLGFLPLLGLFAGLFFLALLLAQIRDLDKNSLWGCVGLHGGLVAGWFFTVHGLLEIQSSAPVFLFGLGADSGNPLGGLIAIVVIFFFLVFISRLKQ